jgi:hypothetical protein
MTKDSFPIPACGTPPPIGPGRFSHTFLTCVTAIAETRVFRQTFRDPRRFPVPRKINGLSE